MPILFPFHILSPKLITIEGEMGARTSSFLKAEPAWRSPRDKGTYKCRHMLESIKKIFAIRSGEDHDKKKKTCGHEMITASLVPVSIPNPNQKHPF